MSSSHTCKSAHPALLLLTLSQAALLGCSAACLMSWRAQHGEILVCCCVLGLPGEQLLIIK